MDAVAQAFFELRFEIAFIKKKGIEFQDFFATLMEKRYPADFMRVRPWGNVGDRKNDGYLKSERTLFQVYAPNEMSAADAVAKIDEDFTEALPYWQQHFDTWVFVHNSWQGLGPDVTKKLLELNNDHDPTVTHWGFEELRRKVFELASVDLASLFGPAPTRDEKGRPRPCPRSPYSGTGSGSIDARTAGTRPSAAAGRQDRAQHVVRPRCYVAQGGHDAGGLGAILFQGSAQQAG